MCVECFRKFLSKVMGTLVRLEYGEPSSRAYPLGTARTQIKVISTKNFFFIHPAKIDEKYYVEERSAALIGENEELKIKKYGRRINLSWKILFVFGPINSNLGNRRSCTQNDVVRVLEDLEITVKSSDGNK